MRKHIWLTGADNHEGFTALPQDLQRGWMETSRIQLRSNQ